MKVNPFQCLQLLFYSYGDSVTSASVPLQVRSIIPLGFHRQVTAVSHRGERSDVLKERDSR